MAVLKLIETARSIDMGKYVVPYVSHGEPSSEPPLVLEHGISMPATHWGRLPHELAALGHRVIAIGPPEYKRSQEMGNLLRYGENFAEATRDLMSGNLFAGWQFVGRMMSRHVFAPTLASYAEDQIPAIHELVDSESYDLLGLSWGGFFGQQIALDDSNRLRRLILAGTMPAAAVPPAERPDLKAMGSVCLPGRSPEEVGAIYGGEIANNPLVREQLREILDREIDPEKHAAQLTALTLSIGPLIARRMWQRVNNDDTPETLVMAGTEDKLMPFKTVRKAAEKLDVEFEAIYGDGHGFLLSQPAAMARIISRFLRRPAAAIQSEGGEPIYDIAA